MRTRTRTAPFLHFAAAVSEGDARRSGGGIEREDMGQERGIAEVRRGRERRRELALDLEWEGCCLRAAAEEEWASGTRDVARRWNPVVVGS